METVDQIGQGIFTLECQIGKGGGGTVWRATELERPNRLVAVKLITYLEEEYEEKEPAIQDLFSREAETWAEFQRSPHVVQLYRTFQQKVRSSDGFRYVLGFVMELAPEGDLKNAIQKRTISIDGVERLTFLIDIAKALQEGHFKGILHRDLKPANVLLFKSISKRFVPKLMDFGLSITSERVGSNMVGTPEYMPPEAFDNPKSLDTSGDVYSLGILYYELITGRCPVVHGQTEKQARLEACKHWHTNASPDFDLIKKSAGLEISRLIRAMLEKRPTDRISLARVISSLARIEAHSIAESLHSTPEEARGFENRFVWNPNLHSLFGERLSYILFSGTSPIGDAAWFKNRLENSGLVGFSIYRILGGYDHILRVWFNSDLKDELERICLEFRSFHNGRLKRLDIANTHLIRGVSPPEFDSPEAAIQSVSEAFQINDPAQQVIHLKKKKSIISEISEDSKKTMGIRFFLMINTGTDGDGFLLPAYAQGFAREIATVSGVRALSVYEGSGDFQLLIKFRLQRFEQFSSVFSRFLKARAVIQRSRALITSRTFIELPLAEDDGVFTRLIESDDGNIVRDVATQFLR